MYYILILPLVLGQLINPECKGKRYLCPVISQSEYCVRIVDPLLKVHQVAPCSDGMVCPYDKAYDSLSNMTFRCVNKTEKVKKYPGQSCQNGNQCRSGACVSVCQGNQNGESCQSDEQCDVSLFCDRNICRPQRLFSQSCQSDSHCKNNCVCNLGICVFYYSLSNGIQASNKKACRTGYIFGDMCHEPPKSEKQLSICGSNSDCIVIFNNNPSLGRCLCGTNGGGYSYCSLVQGDTPYQQMIQMFNYVLMSNIHCHTLLRQGPCQHIYQQQYIKYQRLKLKFERGPELVYNDECTRLTLNHWYWKLGGLNIVLCLVSLMLVSF